MNTSVGVIFVIVVVLILWLIYTMNISSYEDYMTGFWTGDPEFCESTGISDMLVWFDTPEGWTTTRSCYLVINPDIAEDGAGQILARIAFAPNVNFRNSPTILHSRKIYLLTSTQYWDKCAYTTMIKYTHD